tara:strand:+ start:3764 stop:3955 length:192 start_codon:yes stop_codon:yes gene_type:complete
MKKLNGLEAYYINRGLELLEQLTIQDIENVESKGKNPIMTKGFIKRELKGLKDKLSNMTLKSK